MRIGCEMLPVVFNVPESRPFANCVFIHLENGRIFHVKIDDKYINIGDSILRDEKVTIDHFNIRDIFIIINDFIGFCGKLGTINEENINFVEAVPT